MGVDDSRGTLEVGKFADLIVLDTDPLSADHDRLRDIRVDEVFVAGEHVHSRIR